MANRDMSNPDMATDAPKPAASIAVRDEMTAALDAGFAHAAAFYAAGRDTLIDRIAQDEWTAWDGRDEMALVTDPDGVDLTDEMVRDLAA